MPEIGSSNRMSARESWIASRSVRFASTSLVKPLTCDSQGDPGLLGLLRFATKNDARHPSLHFKKIGLFWSARVGLNYRCIGVALPDGVLWFWIGSHADYDRLVG
jgi:hypothetical protein